MINITWQSPSNIAIVKYWGKKDHQIPLNASLSITLKEAVTTTRLEIDEAEPTDMESTCKLLFHGKEMPDFEDRVNKYLLNIREHIPLVIKHHIKLHTQNSFPHSTGIASSASFYASLALCLVSAEKSLRGEDIALNSSGLKLASNLARLGSGSASRSVSGMFNLWGQLDALSESSNEHAIAMDAAIHPVFTSICDAICIVDSGKKKVSSSKGHQLMHGNDYATERFSQANRHCKKLLDILQSGDQHAFIAIMEQEALTLHAMMMLSVPGYLLLKPNTINIIEKIQAFRHDTGIPAGFTLDAGPNIHLLYFEQDKAQVEAFIESELKPLCENQRIIFDKAGMGSRRLDG